MSSNRVERVRYYDGEYLRSYDFQAEQAYHMDMRRRLNLNLHLYGIVTGLELLEDEDSQPPEAPMFVVSPGMAIDQEGREIVAGNPYILRKEEVLNKKGTQTGPNEIWICYKETAAGLPAAGYELCNDRNQKTRLVEQFDVLLVPIPKPAPVPGLELVDPDLQRKGVRLGTVQVDNDPVGGLRIVGVTNEKRTYIGIRAQRLVAPDPSPDQFDVLKKNVTASGGPLPGYVDVDAPVFVRGNVVAGENAVVGPDFEINPADAFKPPLPAMTDPGNLKVTKNLILNGEMFANVSGKWFALADYIRTLLPEFIVGSATIDVDVANTPHPAFTHTSTQLPFVSNASIAVSVNGVVLAGKTDLTTWWSTIVGGTDIQLKVEGVPTRQGNSPNTFDFVLSYTVAPKDNPADPNDAIVAVKQILVNYLVVFYP